MIMYIELILQHCFCTDYCYAGGDNNGVDCDADNKGGVVESCEEFEI
jgi:hypothetical protein